MSKDGTLKEWSLNVKWESGESPKELVSYAHDFKSSKFANIGLNVLYFKQNDRKLVLLYSTDIEFFELEDEQVKKFEKIENAHCGEIIEKAQIIDLQDSAKDSGLFLFTQSYSKLLIWDLNKLKD